MKMLIGAILFALAISRGEFRNIDPLQTCRNMGIWCMDLIPKFPEYCYGAIGDANICCVSCMEHEYLLNPDCPYGDRFKWCGAMPLNVACSRHSSDCCSTCRHYTPVSSSSTVHPTTTTTTVAATTTSSGQCPNGDADPQHCSGVGSYLCYFENDRKLCCNTCSKHSTGISGCEYGDKADWCDRFASRCQTDPSVMSNCCLTCAKAGINATTHAPGQPTCRDSADWCPEYISKFPGLCYNSQGEGATCCGTCQQYKNSSSPECLYGNHVTWCGLNSLDDVCRQSSSVCCDTCRTYSSSKSGASPDHTAAPDQVVSNTSRADACPNGDGNVEYCSKFRPDECYGGHDYCCSTCARYNRGVPGCEYGDRESWCSQYAQYCETDHNVLTSCCQTCAQKAAEVTTVPAQ